MKLDSLILLKCPFCGGDLDILQIMDICKDDIIYGILRCNCSNYSIVDGILNLQLDPLNEHIIKLIQAKKGNEALNLLLWRYSEYFYKFILPRTPSRNIKPLFTEIVQNIAKYKSKKFFLDISFCNLLGKSNYDIYLKHRFSSETFWSIYSFLPLLRGKNKILDICCGAGHSSFVISSHINPTYHFSIDGSFNNLYYNRKYFSKNSQLICMDINYSLPFKDNNFDAIFMLDAFHYINARASLAKEIERLLAYQGIFILSHLHNSLGFNVAKGKALASSEWVKLFYNSHIIAIPEAKIIDSILVKNCLDLETIYSDIELNNSNAISILGGHNTSFKKVYTDLNKDLLSRKDNLIINPIYKKREMQDKLELKINFPSDFYRKEYTITSNYLLGEYVLDKSLLDRIEEGDFSSNPDLIDYLMKRFLLINAPHNYL
jgi:SAM-dependent methyltransferase